jgi:hypothetical protein
MPTENGIMYKAYLCKISLFSQGTFLDDGGYGLATGVFDYVSEKSGRLRDAGGVDVNVQ